MTVKICENCDREYTDAERRIDDMRYCRSCGGLLLTEEEYDEIYCTHATPKTFDLTGFVEGTIGRLGAA